MGIRFTSSKTSAARQLCWKAGDGPPAGGGACAPMCLSPGGCCWRQGMMYARMPTPLEHPGWVLERKQKPYEGCLPAGGSGVRLYLEL